MGKIVRLTESDLQRIVRRVMNEQKITGIEEIKACIVKKLNKDIQEFPQSCKNAIDTYQTKGEINIMQIGSCVRELKIPFMQIPQKVEELKSCFTDASN